MNALLSFLYTLVTHDVAAALEGVGLDPAVGYLHRGPPGASEGWRWTWWRSCGRCWRTGWSLSLVNRRQVQAKGLSADGERRGGDGRRDAQRSAGRVSEAQAGGDGTSLSCRNGWPMGLCRMCRPLLLARYIRGDLDGYPSFLWR
jgi:CRISPR-associated protein Cas1